jgi:protein-tyrosine kinase
MNMTVNQKNIVPASSSLIERAAEAYGLRESLRNNGAAAAAAVPVAVPAPAPVVEAPAPVPVAAPVADAVQQAVAPPVAPVAPVDRAPVAAQMNSRAPMPVSAAPAIARPKPAKFAEIDTVALAESGLIVPGAPPSPLSEEFRIVKRQLLINAFGGRNSLPMDKGRLILTCSAQPNEGKTFSSVNLALSMATETDIDVLLVDADVAKPEVLSTLGLPGGPGLMDALANPDIDIESLVIGTSIKGLSVLPAGRQTNHDTELLASERTPQLIERLSSANPRRIVLFDSAPALAASPASVLALHVGQIMLIVRADYTPESDVREAVAMLEGNARIQLVLNSVTYHGNSKKFGYYYGFGEKS